MIREITEAERALVIGMGGGGDVVGALAVARLCEAWGTPCVLGGVAWERIVVDPRPGPRPPAEIVGGRELGPHARLADPDTATVDGVRFSEALMAEHIGEEILLLDVAGGPAGVRDGIAAAVAELDADLVVLADVGGDVLAVGSEPASPVPCATRWCCPARWSWRSAAGRACSSP